MEAAYEAYGVRVSVRAPVGTGLAMPDVIGLVPAPSGAVDRAYLVEPAEDDGWYTVRGTDRAIEWSLPAEAVQRVIDDDVMMFIAEHATTHAFIHAGAVAVGGVAVLIPGTSMSGKSTLVAALIRAGAVYYSDEWALLSPDDGLVHPYARKLSLRPIGGAGREIVPADELGAATGDEPVPLGAVVLTRYEDDAVWEPERVGAGQGFMGVIANAVAAKSHPAHVMEAIGAALRTPGVKVFEGPRGDAEETAARILARLG